MNDHPIRSLGSMLRQSAKPKPAAKETWCQFMDRLGVSDVEYRAMSERQKIELTEQWLGRLLPLPPLNINSLDPLDARGCGDVIDLDRERAIRDGEFYEKPSGQE